MKRRLCHAAPRAVRPRAAAHRPGETSELFPSPPPAPRQEAAPRRPRRRVGCARRETVCLGGELDGADPGVGITRESAAGVVPADLADTARDRMRYPRVGPRALIFFLPAPSRCIRAIYIHGGGEGEGLPFPGLPRHAIPAPGAARPAPGVCHPRRALQLAAGGTRSAEPAVLRARAPARRAGAPATLGGPAEKLAIAACRAALLAMDIPTGLRAGSGVRHAF